MANTPAAGGIPPSRPLRPKQQRFVEEYLVDLNATQAAIRAGYSAKTAQHIAWELLQKTTVQAAIQAGRERLAQRTRWTRERILAQLEPIAELDFSAVLDWSGERPALRPAHQIPESARQALGKAITWVKLKPVSRAEERALARLRRAARDKDYGALTAALQEVPASPGETTLEVVEFKLCDRLAALEQIARRPRSGLRARDACLCDTGPMGYAKERFTRGLFSVAGSVCAECLGDDPGLTAFVEGSASEDACDFCGKKSDKGPIAATVDDVVDYINECLARDYEDPAEQVPWCSEDAGWGLPVMNTDELLCDELGLELPNDNDEKLLDALCDGLGGRTREWVRQNPYGAAPERVSIWSWERFSRVVKHAHRFFFLDDRDGDDQLLSPRALLRRIARFCVVHQLVRVIPAGARLHRVRKAPPGERPSTPLELGPPPEDWCLWPTRMSPAGIPMFYGADDVETAVQETLDGPGTYIMARFEVTRDVLILDLTDVPRVPSIFEPVGDTAESDPRYELIFLHRFTRDVSEAIDRKDRAHVDYVPTQVVAEYFRSVALGDGRHLDGIKYTSAQCPPTACYALFARQEAVVPSDEDVRCDQAEKGYGLLGHDHAWLRLVDSTERVV
jgi:HEPN/RES N-terminal domain 1/Terminase small subunit/RES domain